MTNLYHNLAAAKDALRRAKDYYETTKAICEWHVVTTGKNETDRKRELIVALASDEAYIGALNELRDAEHAVDDAQAAIDTAETERRDREWQIRARLAEAMAQHHVESEDAIPDWLLDRQTKHRAVGLVKANQQMDEVFG